MAFEPNRSLGPQQERRLIAYLDEKLLDLTRHSKTRTLARSKLQTLTLYLEAAQPILSMILQIPPVDPSTSLRAQYLLRYTHDLLLAVTKYEPLVEEMPALLDALDDLDQAWLILLQGQIWTPEGGAEDLIIDAEAVLNGLRSSPVDQTDLTRLNSLLIAAVATLEEWVGGDFYRFGRDEAEDLNDADDEEPDMDGGKSNVLEDPDVQDGFDQLFCRTLQALGVLNGMKVELPPTTLDCTTTVQSLVEGEDDDDDDWEEVKT